MRETIKSLLTRFPTLFTFVKQGEICYRYLVKQVHDKDFLFFRNFSHIEKGLFVDIGANCGQSALSFATSNKSMNILSFEPNKSLKSNLDFAKKLLGNRFNYNLIGIGNTSSMRAFYVPRIGRIFLTQEGTFNRDELYTIQDRIKDPFEIEQFEFEVRDFDSLDLIPTFVKIDVQGLELDVIEGMRLTIERHHPLIFFENNVNLETIEEILNEFHYTIYLYDHLSNKLHKKSTTTSLNWIAIPDAKWVDKTIGAISARLVE